MKKIIFSLSFLIFSVLQVNAASIHESCSTWAYSSYYSQIPNCNTCWYYDVRFHNTQMQTLPDYFDNINSREYLISTNSANSYSRIHNVATWVTVTYNAWSYIWTNTTWLTANWIPNTAWLNWRKDTIIFLLNNVIWSWLPANRTNPIWLVEYNLKHYEVNASFTNVMNANYSYLSWSEIPWLNWLNILNHQWISSTWIKNINTWSGIFHKECYVMLPAWCWDWVRDVQEACDNWASNWIVWNSCSATCTTVTPSLGGWGGGWGWSFCWNWVLNSWEECDLWSGNNNKWTCTTSCKLTYCWDWVLQRPNSTAKWGALFEECDFGSSTWPSWCEKSTCRIRGDLTTPSSRCVSNCDSTTPSDKDGIIFYPAWWALLWNGMRLWDTYWLSLPYIKNNTGYEIYIPKSLCLYKENKLSLQWNSSICSSSQIWSLSSGQKFDFNIADYTANTSLIPSWFSYQDVNLITSPQGLQNSYLSSVLTVRVAKPTVANVYGWTSLLNFNASLYSDVEALSQNFLNDLRNKNFVVASIADTAWKSFSSYVSSVWNKTTYDNSVNNWNTSTNSTISKVSKTWYTTTIYTLPTQNYNWLKNVFIHKWDVSLNWQTISWNKTFIIEGGNLVINGSIAAAANSNIAFIIKWWNLIVGQNVAKLDWVYLAIKQNSIGWKINSDWNSTNNRLVINGWLYWDARDLLANRTYMKSDNWIINVWTTINFRSGVFKNPPPLLTTFIDEYMKVNKIAK